MEQLDFSASVVFMWFLFVFVSPSVLFHQSHTSSVLFVTHSSSSFSESLSIPKHCEGESTSSQSSGKFFPSVLRPSLAGHKLEPFMVVPHVLFVVDESRGDSICQFACFLFQDTGLLSTVFVFLARFFLDLRHRPFDPLGSASPQVAQSFRQLFATC